MSSTEIPITIDGNISTAIESGTTDAYVRWARFQVAVHSRRLNDQTGEWEDGEPKFHRVAVFGAEAEHVASTFSKGDPVVVVGKLRFNEWTDKHDQKREGTQIIATAVAAVVRFGRVTIDRGPRPKAEGPAASTGPVVANQSSLSADVGR